jgi:hypothetical protein
MTVRYTINSLLGLQRAQALEGEGFADPRELTHRFLERRLSDVQEPADLGLLLALLRETDPEHPAFAETFNRIRAIAIGNTSEHLIMQDVAWMVWGASAVVDVLPQAEHVARTLYRGMTGSYLNRGSLVPRHTTRGYRSRFVSFGALVYFLRAVHEYTKATGDDVAGTLFEHGVRRTCELQGPLGEWPWLIDVSSGRAVDVYPIFGVHQDSMSMLFLLPALDGGMRGLDVTIERSFGWMLGRNELGIRMVHHDPPFFFRAIERDERVRARPYLRARRYFRAVRPAAANRTSWRARARLNPECRSYHPGWVLFAWSGRQDMPVASFETRGVALEPA